MCCNEVLQLSRVLGSTCVSRAATLAPMFAAATKTEQDRPTGPESARLSIRRVLDDRRYDVPVRQRAGQRLSVSATEASAIGRSGVGRSYVDGLPRMEANPKLHPYLARGLCDSHGIYHEMARGDGAVQGTVSIVTREIRRAHFRVEVPADPTDTERAAAELVERTFGLGRWENTGGWIRGGFRQLLDHALQAPVYGFSPVELTWGARRWKGRVVRVPVDAAWRAPWSIDRWYYEGDRLVGMGQAAYDANSMAVGLRFIPIDRCILWVNDYVDGNPEGTSMLRAAYIPWRAKKDTILRQQTAEESLYGGTVTVAQTPGPDGKPYRGASKEDEKVWKEKFPEWVDGDIAWFKVPFGWEVRRSHPEFEIPSRVEELKYYDHQIFLVGLASLLGLDASRAAGRALSDAQAAVLYNAIHGKAVETVDFVNGREDIPWTGAVRTVCDENFVTDEEFRYPRIVPFGIEHQDLSQLTDSIAKGNQYRALTWGVDDELLYRKVSGFLVPGRDELAARRERVHGSLDGESTQITQEGTQGSVIPPADVGPVDTSPEPPSEVRDAPDAPSTDSPADTPAAPSSDIQKENLNGAQSQAIQSLLVDVASGVLPVEASVTFLLGAFPIYSEADARRMVTDAAEHAKIRVIAPGASDPPRTPVDEPAQPPEEADDDA